MPHYTDLPPARPSGRFGDVLVAALGNLDDGVSTNPALRGGVLGGDRRARRQKERAAVLSEVFSEFLYALSARGVVVDVADIDA